MDLPVCMHSLESNFLHSSLWIVKNYFEIPKIFRKIVKNVILYLEI